MTLKVPLRVSSIEFQAERHCCAKSGDDEYPTLTVTFFDGGGGSFYEMRPQSGFGFDADDGVALTAMLKAICEHNDAVEEKAAAAAVKVAPRAAGFPHTPGSRIDIAYDNTAIDNRWLFTRKGLSGHSGEKDFHFWFRVGTSLLSLRQQHDSWLVTFGFRDATVTTRKQLYDVWWNDFGLHSTDFYALFDDAE